ncbi:MAG: hypothetical protein A2512_00605 [Deltaproteobacteria bacterium RIFOXYD12_FULL_56_24]|nr:MAG: hypothetical protein A2512_00605 [Deltaproteobacteria bacterium RIFOXYD12_FULL_56_24]
MKTARDILRRLAWTFVAICVISLGPLARQGWAQGEEEYRFSNEELVQMLAPIALYPDSLVAQILMASTYPLEVVEAERWLRDNEGLEGDALSDALRDKPWDPSLKSLCYFPDVLIAMSENLDQTRKLGDAFLAQEQEVMATVQELRQRALEQGNLETTPEQKVIVEREIIRVEPASPQVVYVPVYDPYYVYGPWWYPAYPPYYWHYPRYPFAGGVYFGFGPRVFIGLDLFSWVWFDWHVHRVNIDVPRTYRFHRYPVRPSYERHYWRHEPSHRRGVAYRDRKTGEHFGVPAPRLQSPRSETRGYPVGTEDRRAPATTAPAPDRKRDLDRERNRPITRENRPEQRQIQTAPSREIPRSAPSRERTITPERRREQQRVAPTPSQIAPPPARERIPAPAESVEPERTPSSGRDTPFRGINEGSFERKAGERGEQSRGSGESRRQNENGRRQGDDSRGRGGGSRR